MEILDESHQYNPVNPLEDCLEPLNSLINTDKSYLLTAPSFSLARYFDWSKWVAISSIPCTCSPSFTFMGGVGKNWNLDVRKNCAGLLNLGGDALRSPYLKTVLIHSTTYKPLNWCLRTFALRATPLVQNMWPCKWNVDEEKSNHASLAQQNGFGLSTFA